MEAVRYHAEVLRLSGLKAKFTNAYAVQERERECGFRFPAAIAEWYSIEGALDLLEQTAEPNSDRGGQITPLETLGDPYPMSIPFGGYIQLYSAGEADFAIFAILDGSEDPAVFVDACEYDDEDLLVPNFFRWKDTFSGFILTWVRRGLLGTED